MTLGQRVAVLRDGTLQQFDTPHNLFHRPANLFVAAFIGSPSMNLVDARGARRRVRFADLELALPASSPLAGARARRDPRAPADVLRARGGGEPDSRGCASSREVVEDLGDEYHVIFTVDAPRVNAEAVRAAADTRRRRGQALRRRPGGVHRRRRLAAARDRRHRARPRGRQREHALLRPGHRAGDRRGLARDRRGVTARREAALERLDGERLDLLVIGGGVVGAAVAARAAELGVRVGLVDRGDFASGTSSASSKLIHGGLRYLRMGDVRLVREALEGVRSARGMGRAAPRPPAALRAAGLRGRPVRARDAPRGARAVPRALRERRRECLRAARRGAGARAVAPARRSSRGGHLRRRADERRAACARERPRRGRRGAARRQLCRGRSRSSAPAGSGASASPISSPARASRSRRLPCSMRRGRGSTRSGGWPIPPREPP